MHTKAMLVLLSILTVIALGVVFKLTASVFIPLVIAWFLVQISRPILVMGNRLKLPHIISVGLVFIMFFLVCFGIAKFFIGQIGALERLFAIYGSKINELTSQAFEFLQIPDDAVSSVGLLRRYIGSISGKLFGFFSHFFMTMVFLLFMLLEVPALHRKIKGAFSQNNAVRVQDILEAISVKTSRYLQTMTLISFITGVSVWLALWIIGVELAGLWGIVAFVLNFIPAVGPFLAVVPPVLVALLQYSPDFSTPLVTLVVVTLIQLITGNILAPKLFGNRLDLSPVVIMLSLLFWSMILGLPGAILSIPMTSILKIVCENIPSLQGIAVLMGNGQDTPELER